MKQSTHPTEHKSKKRREEEEGSRSGGRQPPHSHCQSKLDLARETLRERELEFSVAPTIGSLGCEL